MARASEEFLLAWRSLPPSSDDSGWQTIPVTAPSASCMVRAGRRYPNGQEAILVGFKQVSVAPAEKLPDGQGFFIERVNQNDGVAWLALTRSESGQLDLFLAMVCDVIGLLDQATLADQQTMLRLFLERVRAWQEFMRKGVTALSHEKEVGLIGELLTIKALLAEGLDASTVIDAWKGPLDAEQDFELGTGALEVKTTISQSGFPARIGSLQQLDDSVLQPLFVAGVKLKQTREGTGLAALVSEVRTLLSPSPTTARFDVLLLEAGYFEVHASQYTRTFEQIEMKFMEVVDGFPRLTVGNVPQGVMSAMYSIDLDKTTSSSSRLSQVLNKLGVVAR